MSPDLYVIEKCLKQQISAIRFMENVNGLNTMEEKKMYQEYDQKVSN